MTTTDTPPKPITFVPSGRLIDADRFALMLRELAKMHDASREPIAEGLAPDVAYALELNNFGRTLTAATYRAIAQVLELSRVTHDPADPVVRLVSVPTIPDGRR
jgi:hypothetical protein